VRRSTHAGTYYCFNIKDAGILVLGLNWFERSWEDHWAMEFEENEHLPSPRENGSPNVSRPVLLSLKGYFFGAYAVLFEEAEDIFC
jgi:hypothetical protein